MESKAWYVGQVQVHFPVSLIPVVLRLFSPRPKSDFYWHLATQSYHIGMNVLFWMLVCCADYTGRARHSSMKPVFKSSCIILLCGPHLCCGAQITRTGLLGANHFDDRTYQSRNFWPTSDCQFGPRFRRRRSFRHRALPSRMLVKTSCVLVSSTETGQPRNIRVA